MTDIITVKRDNPEHPYCSNWQFPHGIILGNGPSRHGLDLHKLKEKSAISDVMHYSETSNPTSYSLMTGT